MMSLWSVLYLFFGMALAKNGRNFDIILQILTAVVISEIIKLFDKWLLLKNEFMIVRAGWLWMEKEGRDDNLIVSC